MSEAIRSYRPPKRTHYEGPARQGGAIRWIVLCFFVLAAVWLVWTTRDNCPVERVIPRSQSYHVQVRDLLATREEIARSAIWDTGLVPENYAGIPLWIGNSFGYPDWVLNNLVSDVCYVSGTDLMAFSDLLVVTRMSRVGCLLERCHRFIDEIEDEHAGGLALRKLSGVDVYYAVRGRTLVFSPSRDALIRALTLREADALDSLETAGLDATDDLRGRMVFNDEEPLGRYFEQSDCRLDIGPESITFTSHSTLKPDWRAPLDALGLKGSPDPVSVPAYGGVAVVGDFGVPLAKVWNAANQMSAGALDDYVLGLGALDQLSASEREALVELLGQMSGMSGSSFAVRAVAFDVDGMAPIPVLDLILQPGEAAAQSLLELVPVVGAGVAAPGEGVPYRSEDGGILRLPLAWGDILEPSAFWENGRFHVALHPNHIEVLQAADNTTVPSRGGGHLYFRLRPGELAESLREGAYLYAEQDMLIGHTPASLDTTFSEVRAVAERVPEISVTAGYSGGDLSVELVLYLATSE